VFMGYVCQEGFVTSVLEAVSRASGSPFRRRAEEGAVEAEAICMVDGRWVKKKAICTVERRGAVLSAHARGGGVCEREANNVRVRQEEHEPEGEAHEREHGVDGKERLHRIHVAEMVEVQRRQRAQHYPSQQRPRQRPPGTAMHPRAGALLLILFRLV